MTPKKAKSGEKSKVKAQEKEVVAEEVPAEAVMDAGKVATDEVVEKADEVAEAATEAVGEAAATVEPEAPTPEADVATDDATEAAAAEEPEATAAADEPAAAPAAEPAAETDPEPEADAKPKSKADEPAGKKGKRDFSYTQNREASWLLFDGRVLDESLDETVPLFERLKFVSIFGSNLDEWFMVRVGGLTDLAMLKKQPKDSRSNQTPSEQLQTIFQTLPPLLARQEEAFTSITAQLAKRGLVHVTRDAMTDADMAAVARYFDTRVSPIISPLIIDPRHPFPNLRNGRLFVICSIEGFKESQLVGLIEVPRSLGRVVALPSSEKEFRYTLLEDVIISRLDGCFGQYTPTNPAVIRVTRNAEIDPDGEGVAEEEDYLQHMKKVLKKRLRLQPIRLEVQGTPDASVEKLLRKELSLARERIFHTTIPLDLGYVYSLEEKIPASKRTPLVEEPFSPQASPMVDASVPMRQQVEDHDVLLFYPYESMSPLLTLVREAALDDDCISIKITLYRVASQSHLCESLIMAAEAGKDVTVLMELRARFDEENNIAWAERLESAGCTVIYGSQGFKCHSKICSITYHNQGGIRRITCLGTGNFNEKTAKLYSDFMLLTAHEGIGEDGSTFFRNLSLGSLRGTYKHLGVAPFGLKPLIMRGLDREIARAKAGKPAQVFFKMNSLTDRDVIDKLAAATQAGVRVMMIVRGICCIKANVEGKTDGLEVHQIVGRYLEHARVYAFGAESDTIYLSSADMMTRNTEHRVEIAYPVLDDACRKLVVTYMNLQLADNVKARRLTSDGSWEKVARAEGEPAVNAQDLLMELAVARASGNEGNDPVTFVTPCAGIALPMPTDVLAEFTALPEVVEHLVMEAPISPETTGKLPSVPLPATEGVVADAAESGEKDEPAAAEVAVVAEPEQEPETAAVPEPEATPEPVAVPAPEPTTEPATVPSPAADEPAKTGAAAGFKTIWRGIRMIFGGR